MKPSLLRSFIILALFWSAVGWLFFGLADPVVNQQALERVARFVPKAAAGMPASVTVLDGAWMQYRLFLFWTVPVLVLTALLGLLGAAAMWHWAYKESRAREGRERGRGQWRGISITRDELPLPPDLSLALADELHLQFHPETAEQLTRLEAAEHALLVDVLRFVGAHPDAYPGAGHGVTLLEHTLHVLDQVARAEPADPLALVAAVAHDIGKITTFERDPITGEWVRKKFHDQESARLLALLPSYWDLASIRRRALTVALGHGHSEDALPKVQPEVDQLVLLLLDAVHKADRQATRQEKEVVLHKATEQQALPTTVLEAFLQALPTFVFSAYNLPKGTKSVAWRKAGRLYLIEHQAREQILAQLEPDLRAALGRQRRQEQVALVTRDLLRAFNEKGWLITEVGESKVPCDQALWDIRAGKLEFQGIIVIQPPAEVLDKAPRTDTAYPIEILAPHFRVDSAMYSPADLMEAGLMRKKPKLVISPQVSTQVPTLTADPTPAVKETPEGPSLTETGPSSPEKPSDIVVAAPVAAPDEAIGPLAGETLLEEVLPVGEPMKATNHAGLSADELASLSQGSKPRRRRPGSVPVKPAIPLQAASAPSAPPVATPVRKRRGF